MKSRRDIVDKKLAELKQEAPFHPMIPRNRSMSLALLCALIGALGWLSEQSAAQEPEPATKQQAEYWSDNTPQLLHKVQSVPEGAKVVAINDLPLILKEQTSVNFAGATYRLDREGLYRFRQNEKVVRQVILYEGDAWRLAAALDRLYVYGMRHQSGGLDKITERARNGEPVSLQCGIVALFVITHLGEHGIPARMVNSFTTDAWQGYDDGHVLMELHDPVEKRWILFDPTLGARYRKDGRWLDLLDMTQLYRAGGRPDEIDFVNSSSKIDPLTNYDDIYGGFIKDKKQLALYVTNFKLELSNDADVIHKWYAHILHIPLIGNTFVPGSNAEDALMRKLKGFEKLERLTPAQFRERNYPER